MLFCEPFLLKDTVQSSIYPVFLRGKIFCYMYSNAMPSTSRFLTTSSLTSTHRLRYAHWYMNLCKIFCFTTTLSTSFISIGQRKQMNLSKTDQPLSSYHYAFSILSVSSAVPMFDLRMSVISIHIVDDFLISTVFPTHDTSLLLLKIIVSRFLVRFSMI